MTYLREFLLFLVNNHPFPDGAPAWVQGGFYGLLISGLVVLWMSTPQSNSCES